MSNSNDNRTVDELLDELSSIYKNDYVAYKSHEKPYKNIIDNVKLLRNSANSSDLNFAIQEKLNTKETFLNFEASIWGNLFIIVGLFTAIFADIIINNYEETFFSAIPKKISILIVTLIALIEIILYCTSVLGPTRRKNKKKCFYKFVYDILTHQEN